MPSSHTRPAGARASVFNYLHWSTPSRLACDAKGRETIEELIAAGNQATLNQLTTRHQLPGLHVPSLNGHGALIYTAVVALASASASASASSDTWAIIRYEGPFRRRRGLPVGLYAHTSLP